MNPFLESVQNNSGLSAFRVVMDDSNNTPDVIDRNQLVGQIFIQPTRTGVHCVGLRCLTDWKKLSQVNREKHIENPTFLWGFLFKIKYLLWRRNEKLLKNF